MSKMNALAISQSENTAVTIPGTIDPFAAYANAVAPQNIIGSLMKFSKGDFLAGEDSKPIEVGTNVTANLDELLVGWICWKEGKPVEHRMVRIADGVTPARREELGDDDPTKWEVDTNNGQPKDPWQFANYLPLMTADGTLYTFTTSSRGGLGAVGDLARRYAKHRRKHDDVFPLVALDVDSYKHQNKSYGIIKVPQFTPAGWESKNKFAEAMAAAGLSVNEVAPAEPLPPVSKGMDDEIPF
jgi:hypothetical protein